nr:hypothetical protein [uncultured Bacteroides sp.]
MKVVYLMGLVIFYFSSCARNKSNCTYNNLSNKVIAKDTIISYDLENISSEGAEALVQYKNRKIVNSSITIYGGMGQSKITYKFLDAYIHVEEKDFIYNTAIENINSEKDMKLQKEISYVIDLQGTPQSKVDSERIDIFKEFKEIIPFKLY